MNRIGQWLDLHDPATHDYIRSGFDSCRISAPWPDLDGVSYQFTQPVQSTIRNAIQAAKDIGIGFGVCLDPHRGTGLDRRDYHQLPMAAWEAGGEEYGPEIEDFVNECIDLGAEFIQVFNEPGWPGGELTVSPERYREWASWFRSKFGGRVTLVGGGVGTQQEDYEAIAGTKLDVVDLHVLNQTEQNTRIEIEATVSAYDRVWLQEVSNFGPEFLRWLRDESGVEAVGQFVGRVSEPNAYKTGQRWNGKLMPEGWCCHWNGEVSQVGQDWQEVFGTGGGEDVISDRAMRLIDSIEKNAERAEDRLLEWIHDSAGDQVIRRARRDMARQQVRVEDLRAELGIESD